MIHPYQSKRIRSVRAAAAAISWGLAGQVIAASGIWTSTAATGDWSTQANWADGTIADGSGFTASFTSDITAATSVVLDSPRTIGHLVFSDNGSSGNPWTLTGSQVLTLAGTTPRVTTHTDATISTRIAGINGLTKSAPGTLTLSGSNTYTGTTVVESGTLRIMDSADASRSSAFNVLAGATLTIGDAILYNGAVSTFSGGKTSGSSPGGQISIMSGAVLLPNAYVVMNGGITVGIADGASLSGGTLLHLGYNVAATSYSGENSISMTGGTVAMSSGIAIGAHESGIFNQSGGTLTAATNGVVLRSIVATGNGIYNLSGGTLVSPLAGINLGANAGGTWNFTGGTAMLNKLIATTGTPAFNFGGGILKATDNFTIAANIPITLTGSGGAATIDTNSRNIQVAGVISGGGGLVKSGPGSLTMTATNTYTGTTNILGGALVLDGAGGIPSSSSLAITGHGSLVLANPAGLSDKLADAAAITMASGHLLFAHQAAQGTSYGESIGPVTVQSGLNALTTNRASPGQSSVLNLANLTISGGRLDFSGDGLGATVDPRNTIILSGIAPGTVLPPSITINGSQRAMVDANSRLVTAPQAMGFTDIAARGPSEIPDAPDAFVRILDDGIDGPIYPGDANGDFTTAITSLSMVNPDHAAVVDTYFAAISTGGIVVDAAAESLAIGMAPDDGELVSMGDGATLHLDNQSTTNALTINARVVDYNYQTGYPCALVKYGPGVVELTATNYYRGDTTILAGTLALTGYGSLLNGNYPQAIRNDGLLRFASHADQTLAGVISGSGNLLVESDAGTLTLSANNTYSGGTTVTEGTLELQHSAAVPTVIPSAKTINVGTSGTLSLVHADGDFTFANALTGTGTVRVDPHHSSGLSARTVTLSGNNTGFTGTLVLAGSADTDGAAGSFRTATTTTSANIGNGSVLVLPGGQLNLAANQIVANPLVLSGVGYGTTTSGPPITSATGADGSILDIPSQPYLGSGALLASSGTITGNVLISGDAMVIGADFSGTLRAVNPATDDLIIGGGTGTYTQMITGNASGLGRIWINGGGASYGNIGTSTLIIGNNGATGTLGAGDVILYSNNTNAVLQIQRSDGYTLGLNQDIIAARNTTNGNYSSSYLYLNATGSGFNTASNDILLTESPSPTSYGILRVASNAAGAILNITGDSIVRTGEFGIGLASGMSGSVNQSGNSTVEVFGPFILGSATSETSYYNLVSGSVTMPDTVTSPTGESDANLFVGLDGTGVFTISGGTLNTTSLVVNGRSETHNGTKLDTLNLTGGRMNLGKWGMRTKGTSYAVNLGNGTVGATANWASSLNMNLTGSGGGNVIVDTLDARDGTTPRTITLTGVLSGSGGLTKVGAGNLVLGGTSGTFTGTARVENGTLYSNGTAAATATLHVVTGGTIRPGLPAAYGNSFANNLVLDGGTAMFRLNTTSASDKYQVTNFVLNSPTKIEVELGTNFVLGQEYTLVEYSGSATGLEVTPANLVIRDQTLTATITHDTVNKKIKLIITNIAPLVWRGTANGTWDVNGNINWIIETSGVPATFTNIESVLFNDTGLTRPDITINGLVTPKSVRVENTTGTITMGGNAISGATALAKSGAGTLVLTNDNSYTGTTTLSGGTLQLGNGSTIGKPGTGNIVMSNNAALVVNRSDAVTLSNVISGAGTLGKMGAGPLTLGMANTYTGGTAISGGAITASNGGALGSGPVFNTAILNLTLGSGSYTFGAVSGSGLVNIGLGFGGTSIGFPDATTWNGFTGQINVGVAQATSSGRLTINNPLPVGVSVNVTAHSTFSSTAASANHAAAITLFGGDTGESLGQLRLDSGSTWSGPITLAGNITGSNDGFIGTNSGLGIISGNIGESGGAKNLSKAGTGTTQLSGNTSHTGGTSVLAGTLQISGAGTLQSGNYPGAISLATGSFLRHSSSANQILSGVISGSGGLTKDTSAASTLTLRAANTFTGATTVSAGTLSLDYASSNDSKLADAAAFVLGSGTLTLAGASGNHTELVASTTINGAATITRSGANSAKINLGGISLAGGVLDVTESATLANTTTALDAGGLLAGVTVNGELATKDGSNNIIANTAFTEVNRRGGLIATDTTTNVRIIEAGASGNVTMTAAGTTGINTLTNSGTGGTSTVDIGAGNTLRLGAYGSVVAGPTSLGLTFTNGTLTAGGAENTGGTIVINNNSAVATTVESVIGNNGSGVISITANGSGGTVLTASNTYSGTTSISAGSNLTIGGSGSLNNGSYAGAINHGGTFRYSSSANQTLSGIISGTGSLIKDTSGSTLTLTAKNPYSGGTTVNTGMLNLGGTGGVDGIIIGEVTVNTGATLQLNGGSVLGTGTTGLQVSTINLVGGTMHNNVTSTNQTLTNCAVNMTGAAITGISGSNLDFFRGGSAINTLASSTTSTISTVSLTIRQATGLTITTAEGSATDDLHISSAIAANGFPTAPLKKAGAGTLTLTGAWSFIQGANTLNFTAPIQVDEGTLQIGNGGTAGTLPPGVGSVPAVTNNATLKFNRSNALAVANVISGTGSLVQSGAGTTTLSAVNTYTGETQVLAGTLSIVNDCLADVSTVRIAADATLHLPHANTDTIDKLYVNGVQQAAGLYKSSTATGAGTVITELTGTGKLQVTTGPLASTPYSAWATSMGLTVGVNDGKGQDPDNDGRPNILEYALNGKPLSGADDGKMRARAETVSGQSVFTLTLPVRSGAVFSGDTAKSATVDGVTYRIEGSETNLTAWDLVVTEVAPARAEDPPLPALDPGWSYRTFRCPGAIAADPDKFLRTRVEETLSP